MPSESTIDEEELSQPIDREKYMVNYHPVKIKNFESALKKSKITSRLSRGHVILEKTVEGKELKSTAVTHVVYRRRFRRLLLG
jgi:tricorn protease-like protein